MLIFHSYQRFRQNLQSNNYVDLDEYVVKILEGLKDKLKVYRYERHPFKANFFQVNAEKENEINLLTFDAFQSVFVQFLKDPKKFFYFMTTNFIVAFLHAQKNEKEEVQTIGLLCGKNKNVCKLLEKESIHFNFRLHQISHVEIQYQILHKHEKMEGISTPQKLQSLEQNRNLIYGLEVGPGVELLKITQKNVYK